MKISRTLVTVALVGLFSVAACAPDPTGQGLSEPLQQESAATTTAPRDDNFSLRVDHTSTTNQANTLPSASHQPASPATSLAPTPTPSVTPSPTTAANEEQPPPSPQPTQEPPTKEPPATAGPVLLSSGDVGEQVRDLQARLKQIRWFNERVTGNYGPITSAAVRGFQAKRGLPATGNVDQATLDALHAMTTTPTAKQLADEPEQTPEQTGFSLDSRCLTGRVICVSKSQRKLAWVVDGKIRLTTDVRFGSELTPTREGTFSVGWKSRDHVSSLYHTPMPFALFFSGGQAIHFSQDFANRGYNGASHGCVNVRDRAVAQSLFETSKVGDRVVVFT